MAKSYKEQEKYFKMLNDLANKLLHPEVDINAIETALGFSLYPWVKRVLLTGKCEGFPIGRKTGKTTCSILCLLLTDYDFKDIDIELNKSNRMKNIYNLEVIRIQNKLINYMPIKTFVCCEHCNSLIGLHNTSPVDQKELIYFTKKLKASRDAYEEVYNGMQKAQT